MHRTTLQMNHVVTHSCCYKEVFCLFYLFVNVSSLWGFSALMLCVFSCESRPVVYFICCFMFLQKCMTLPVFLLCELHYLLFYFSFLIIVTYTLYYCTPQDATSESTTCSEKRSKESSNKQRNEATTVLSDRESTDTALLSGKHCKEPALHSDKKTDDHSPTTEVCDTKAKAVSSEYNDTECQLAEFNEVMSKLSDSVQNLEATKAAYSIGIRLDPEDLDEDEQIRSPGECVISITLIEVVAVCITI